MSFLPNLDALQQISRRVELNKARIEQARTILNDAKSDLNALPTEFAAQLAIIDADVAASIASGDAAQIQTAGITSLAKASGDNDRTAAIAKIAAMLAAG